MAIDITGLQEYVKLYPELIGKLTNRDSILKMFVPHLGATPGPCRFRWYNPETNFQNCCTKPEGSSRVEEKDIEVVCIQDGDEYCENDLASILRDSTMRFTAAKESAGSVEEVIVNQNLASLCKALDTLVFQGDIALADGNLNKIDGLIKQANDASDSVKLSIASGNIYTAIQQIILSIPAEAYDMGDIGVFVGLDVYNALQARLIGLNLYHFNPGSMNPGTQEKSLEMPGFAGVRIIGTRGLNGTNKVVASPLNNIHWITNLENDHMEMLWDYNSYHEVYFWRIKFILGVTFGITEYVLLANLDSSVINTDINLDVTVTNRPLTVSGTVGVSSVSSSVNVNSVNNPVTVSSITNPVTVRNDGSFATDK